MKILITGGAGSGKSALAQELALALSGDAPRYYVAAMVPRDGEDRRRIRRHIEDRSGMDFESVECPMGLSDNIKADPEGTYLMDSVTALLSNAMFGSTDFHYVPDAAEQVKKDLETFSGRVRHFIAVSDGIYSDALRYDPMTEGYRQGLAAAERHLAALSDAVVECSAGGAVLLKGALPEEVELVEREENGGMEVIVGGAHAGKTQYAAQHFGISKEEIFVCSENGTPDFNARCIGHLERYLRHCAAADLEPAPPASFREDAVIICEDITCGIVPVDPLDRKWREMTGRYLQRLAREGAGVTRVVCGFGQRLAQPVRVREVLLLRHGRTEANEKRQYCGSTDQPLSAKGREEIENKAALYGPLRGSLYTSGMRRTDGTMEILAGPACTYRREPGLREMDFGGFEGKTYEELCPDPDYRRWICGDNERNRCPGGESGEQMEERVRRTFDRILREDPAQRIVIVTHGGPIAGLMRHFFPEEDKNRYEWQPGCGEGYLLKIRGAGPGPGAVSYRPFG